MFSRKDRFLHQEPNKIGFAFFWFFYDFLRIFEVVAENPNTHLHRDPQLKSQIHESVPALHKTPWEDWRRCNRVLGGTGDAAGGNWPRYLAGFSPGKPWLVWPTSSPLVSPAWLELGRGAPAACRPSYGRRGSVCGGRRLQGTPVVWLGRFREGLGVLERCGCGERSSGSSGPRAQRQLCLWRLRSGGVFQEEGALLVLPQRKRERGGVDLMAPSERPSGHSCMRTGRTARASDGTWPGARDRSAVLAPGLDVESHRSCGGYTVTCGPPRGIWRPYAGASGRWRVATQTWCTRTRRGSMATPAAAFVLFNLA
jgi:hypothetical protein